MRDFHYTIMNTLHIVTFFFYNPSFELQMEITPQLSYSIYYKPLPQSVLLLGKLGWGQKSFLLPLKDKAIKPETSFKGCYFVKFSLEDEERKLFLFYEPLKSRCKSFVIYLLHSLLLNELLLV